MDKIIINNGAGYFKETPQAFLRINALFRKMGFEEVNIRDNLREEGFFEKLTLSINPKMASRYCYHVDIENKFPTMKGNYNLGAMESVINYGDDSVEDIEKIFINEVHLGDYYKKRNLVIFFYPIKDTERDIGVRNEFLFYLLEELRKEIVRIKMKTVNIKNRAKEQLIKKFSDEIKKTLVNLKEDITQHGENIIEYEKEVRKYYSKITQKEIQIKVLRGARDQVGKDIHKKIREIKKLKFVQSVSLSSLGIRVDFEHIDLRYKGEVVELGECFAYLNPADLKIKNKTPVVYDGHTTYHSPHIKDSSVCFGEAGKKKAYELLGAMKLKELVYFIYLYLKTYNEDDTFLSLSSWKKGKKNGGVLTSERGDDD